MEEQTGKLVKAALRFFTKEDKITFIANPPSILLGDPNEKRLLNSENYFGFQDLVSHACAMKDLSEDTIEFLETDSP
jgi:hypothetical protein